MKLLLQLTVIGLFSTTSLMYSQKIEKLEDIDKGSFTNSTTQSPTILSYRTVVTFPYKQDNGKAGAKDEYFTLQIESLVRIRINSTDTIKQFLGLSNTFESGIKISSIKYYYLNGKSVSDRKIKEQDVSTLTDNIGVYINYSKVVQDSCAILDISFKSDSKTKKNMLFYKDRKINYIDYSLQIFIPEIYFYDILTPDQCIKTEIKGNLIGPKIGYDPGTGPNKPLLSEALASVFKAEFKSNYNPVYCKINQFSFTRISACDLTTIPIKELVILKLKNSIEIK